MKIKKIIAATLAATMLFSSIGYANTASSETNDFSSIPELETDELSSQTALVSTDEMLLNGTNELSISDLPDVSQSAALAFSVANSTSIDGAMVWDFADYHGDTGTINQDITHNGITLHATANKPVAIQNSTIPYTGNTYIDSQEGSFPTRLNLLGKGRDSYRNLSFQITESVDIYVIAKASYPTTRNLVFAPTLNTTNVPRQIRQVSSGDVYKFTYEVNSINPGGTFYIASEQDDIYIYYIAVVPREDELPIGYTGKTWDFTNLPLGEIEDNYDYDGLEINAYDFTIPNTTNNIDIGARNIISNGFQYTNYAHLFGMGNRRGRNLTFYMPVDTEAYITAQSTGGTRTLYARNIHGDMDKMNESFTVNNTPQTFKISNDSGLGQGVSLYSMHEGIYIFCIKVVVKNTSSNTNLANLNASSLNPETFFDEEPVANNVILYATNSNPVYLALFNGRMAYKAKSLPIFKDNGGYFKFNLPYSENNTSTLKITAYNDSTMYVVDEYGYLVGEIPASNSYVETTINYTGSKIGAYLYSTGNMYISKIICTQ